MGKVLVTVSEYERANSVIDCQQIKLTCILLCFFYLCYYSVLSQIPETVESFRDVSTINGSDQPAENRDLLVDKSLESMENLGLMQVGSTK